MDLHPANTFIQNKKPFCFFGIFDGYYQNAMAQNHKSKSNTNRLWNEIESGERLAIGMEVRRWNNQQTDTNSRP